MHRSRSRSESSLQYASGLQHSGRIHHDAESVDVPEKGEGNYGHARCIAAPGLSHSHRAVCWTVMLLRFREDRSDKTCRIRVRPIGMCRLEIRAHQAAGVVSRHVLPFEGERSRSDFGDQVSLGCY